MKESFHRIALRVSIIIGSPTTFVAALFLVIFWALSGPMFGFSDTWQLVINTSTTILTFLTVILIQNTQNRDSKALHLKIDELIRSSRSARDEFIRLESLPDEELEQLDIDFQKIGAHKPSHVLNKLHKTLESEKARRMSMPERFARDVGDAIKNVGHD